jgi:hypothetical protein
MIAEEMSQLTTAWRSVGRFLFDWVKSLGLFAIIVAAGTFLFLVCSSLVGYLAYSDRPGPGWGRGAFSWGEVEFFAGWLPLLTYTILYVGAPLFPFARLLAWFHSPRWLLRVFGGLFAGVAALVGVLAAGWYIAISQSPVLAGGIAGVIYGVFLLPRFSNSSSIDRRTCRHRATIATTIIAFGAIVFYPLLPKQSEQSLEVHYVRVVPGPGDLTADPGAGALTPDELKFLKSLALTGRLQFGISEYRNGSPTEARAVIVFTGELRSRVELRQPLKTHVIYVQQGDGWKMYPSNATTMRNKIRFWPSTTDSSKIEVQSDPAMGQPNSFSWYPPALSTK